MKLIAFLTILLIVSQAQKTEGKKRCKTMFRGKMVRYPNCEEVGDGFATVYWRVSGKKIITLLEADSSGYFGFGWGFNQMIGSTVKVLYSVKKKGVLSTYFLKAKRSSAVTRTGKPKKAFIAKGRISAVYHQKIKGVVKPGQLNFAIFCIGDKPESPPKLTQHSNRGILSLKV